MNVEEATMPAEEPHALQREADERPRLGLPVRRYRRCRAAAVEGIRALASEHLTAPLSHYRQSRNCGSNG